MAYYWLQKVRIYEEILKKDQQKYFIYRQNIFINIHNCKLIPCCVNCLTAPH